MQTLRVSKVSLRKQNLSVSGVRPLRTQPEVTLLGMIWVSGITLQSLVEARGLLPFVNVLSTIFSPCYKIKM